MAEPSNILMRSLKRVLEERGTLTRNDAKALLEYIFDVDDFGAEIRTAALLGAMAARGETVEELAGFVDAMRARTIQIPLAASLRAQLVDTCGTGGDLSGTFNISTAAGLVAAAAGAVVAKHGNRAVTSRSGSADVLEALGIAVDHTPEGAAAALRGQGFAFLPAPGMQPAMKAVMPIRRAMGVRTAFNILGPMTNPAGAPAQVMGVYAERLVAVAAKTLARVGTRHALVVHGGGMDELTVAGESLMGEVRDGAVTMRRVRPAEFGLEEAGLEALAGGDAETNAEILRGVFAGERGPRRDVVVMNAAAVLVVADLARDFLDGARLAEETIDQGKVTRLVATLAAGDVPKE